MVSPFWSEPCPARGAALSHAHWDKCTPEAHPGEDSGHIPMQCCHCRAIDPGARATVIIVGFPAPFNINDRLRQMGLIPPARPVPEETGVEDIKATWDSEDPDDVPREPQMRSPEHSLGPQGNKYGHGRGEATDRFLARVAAYVGFHQRNADPADDRAD